MPDAVDESHVDEVFRSFTTLKYRRCPLKFPKEIRENIKEKIAAAQPIEFLSYWGKGRRNEVASPERQAIEHIERMRFDIGQVHLPGALMNVVYTDTHATLNNLDHINEYYSSLKGNIPTEWVVKKMSDLVPSPPEECLLAWEKCDDLPQEVARILEDSAARHSMAMNRSNQEQAGRYIGMSLWESCRISREFPRHIFATYNRPVLDFLSPAALPIFHMRPYEKGPNDKPWFRSA